MNPRNNPDDPHHGEQPPYDPNPSPYIRTHPSDTGAEPLAPGLPFWVSPDIVIIPSGGSPGGVAVAGVTNQVRVTVTNTGGGAADDAYVDAFVADPSTAFTPATASFIGGGFLDIPGYNTADISFTWNPTPAEAGHRCLLARVSLPVYGATYDPTIFDVVGDRNVAQRNIHVLELEPQEMMASFAFAVTNPLGHEANFGLRFRELRPTRALAQQVRGALCGFARLGGTPLRDLQLGIDEVLPPLDQSIAQRDARRPPLGLLAEPLERGVREQLQVGVGVGEVYRAVLTVTRDEQAQLGTLHIVQVEQIEEQTGAVVGGIWVAVTY
jgi:hypothetical protein